MKSRMIDLEALLKSSFSASNIPRFEISGVASPKKWRVRTIFLRWCSSKRFQYTYMGPPPYIKTLFNVQICANLRRGLNRRGVWGNPFPRVWDPIHRPIILIIHTESELCWTSNSSWSGRKVSAIRYRKINDIIGVGVLHHDSKLAMNIIP